MDEANELLARSGYPGYKVIQVEDEYSVVEKTRDDLIAEVRSLVNRCYGYKATLEHIVRLGDEWDLNKLGRVELQRKRWLRMRDMARRRQDAEREVTP